ncbi:MAG: hypothetical protein KA170_01135 [Candidatus Promineofilum sp.]|nr:hypothetical protein [Promineifilum sp.]
MDRKQREELKALENELKEKREKYLERLSGLPFSYLKLSEADRKIFLEKLVVLKEDIARLEATVMETYHAESTKAHQKYEDALQKSERWKWLSNSEPSSPQTEPNKCSNCKGKGFESIRCNICNGSGILARWENSFFPPKCNGCDGTGKMRVPCPQCMGSGYF